MGTRVTSDIAEDIRATLRGMRGEQARTLAREVARQYGLSVRHVYSLTRGARGNGHAPRTRKPRVTISDEQRDYLLNLIVEQGFSIPHALRRGIAAEMLTDLQGFSESYLAREIRKRWLSGPNQRPCRRVVTERPNQMHQFDWTPAAALYINADGSVGWEPERARKSSKGGNQRPRLLIAGIIDDYSRFAYARAYVAENAYNTLDFLYRAWSNKGPHLLHGLPERLYTDNGMVMHSERFDRAMTALGVQWDAHQPYHPQSKGKIERFFRTLTEYQKDTKLDRFATVDQFNEALLERALEFYNCSRAHRGIDNVTPAKRWHWNGSDSIRGVPDEQVYRSLFFERHERQVNAHFEVSLLGRTFYLPWTALKDRVRVGDKVALAWCPEEAERCWIVLGREQLELGTDALAHQMPEERDAHTRDQLARMDLRQVRHEPVAPEQLYAPFRAPILERPKRVIPMEALVGPLPMRNLITLLRGIRL
jgi:transposase InsO family protein